MTARAGWPTVTFEVAFNADPNSATAPVWTDLSSRLLSFDWKIGRSYELAHVETGEGVFNVRNDDGALDPTNASSTYYPNVKLFRGARLRATWSAVTYDIARGYVERWPLQWSKGFGSAPMSVVDGFAVLGARVLRNIYDEAVVTGVSVGDPKAVAYYMLNEEAGSTTITDALATSGVAPSTFIYSGNVGGTYAFGEQSTVVGVESTWLRFNSAASRAGGYIADLPGVTLAGTAGSGFMLEFWMKPGTITGVLMARLLNVVTPANVALLNVGISPIDGTINGSIDGGAHLAFSGSGNYNDGRPHHVLISYYNGSGGGGNVNKVEVYVDGLLDLAQSSAAGAAFNSFTSNRLQLAGDVDGANTFYDGAMADVAVYNVGLASGGTPNLSAFAISHYFGAGRLAASGEGAGSRISRLLGQVPWRLGSSVDTSPTVMGPTLGQEGTTALDAILDVANDEGGVAYCAGDGSLVFTSRRTRMLATAAAYTFGDGGGSELPYDSLDLDYDPTYVFNDVQITMTSTGKVATAVDATSGTRYFPRQLQDDYNITSDSELIDAANYLLNTHKEPVQRPSQLVFTPSANTALWPAALNIKIGTRITVKRRPLGGHAVSLDCFVEGIAHSVTESKWTVTLELSPVLAQVLIADDAVFGLADSAYVAAY